MTEERGREMREKLCIGKLDDTEAGEWEKKKN